MMRTIINIIVLTSALACGAPALAAQDVIIEARLFKGSRQAQTAGSDVVVSSFVDPLVVSDDPGRMRTERELISAMRTELFDIYQLRSIQHITTSRFVWDGKKENLGGTITLSERNYPIAFYPEQVSSQELRIRIQVNRLRSPGLGGQPPVSPETRPPDQPSKRGEPESGETGQALLDTEIDLGYDWPVVLGFPENGYVYFLSISVARRKVDPGSEHIIPGGFSGEGYLPPPLPLREVTPEYPAALKEALVEGTVILNLSIDTQGRVAKVTTLISTHPELERSAHAALQQWRYEPVLKRGRPIPAVFAVAVEYRLREGPAIENPSNPERRGRRAGAPGLAAAAANR